MWTRAATCIRSASCSTNFWSGRCPSTAWACVRRAWTRFGERFARRTLSGPARGSPRAARFQAAAEHRRTQPAKLASLLRGDLDWITMKALEKDRTRRYQTANALALDVRRHLNHEPVSAGPPSAAYRTRKFVRRHRVGVAAVAVLVALLATFAGRETSSQAHRAGTRSRQSGSGDCQAGVGLSGRPLQGVRSQRSARQTR